MDKTIGAALDRLAVNEPGLAVRMGWVSEFSLAEIDEAPPASLAIPPASIMAPDRTANTWTLSKPIVLIPGVEARLFIFED